MIKRSNNPSYKSVSAVALTLFFLFCAISALYAQASLEEPGQPIAKKHAKSGLFEDEVIELDAAYDLFKSNQKILFLDARTKQSYDELRISGAQLPLSDEYYRQQELLRKGIVKSLPDAQKDLEKSSQRFSKETTIITYCNDDCQASSVLLIRLKKLGFKKVFALTEGVQSWQKMGYPVEGQYLES